MKTLLAATAALALIAGAGAASAQMYQPINPAPAQPMPSPYQAASMPSWMQDDGSSSDYPIHNPGDHSGDPLNAQYQGGIPTAPGHGFPAYPGGE